MSVGTPGEGGTSTIHDSSNFWIWPEFDALSAQIWKNNKNKTINMLSVDITRGTHSHSIELQYAALRIWYVKNKIHSRGVVSLSFGDWDGMIQHCWLSIAMHLRPIAPSQRRAKHCFFSDPNEMHTRRVAVTVCMPPSRLSFSSIKWRPFLNRQIASIPFQPNCNSRHNGSILFRYCNRVGAADVQSHNMRSTSGWAHPNGSVTMDPG